MDISIGTKPFIPDHDNCSGDAVARLVGAVFSAGCGAGIEGESADEQEGGGEKDLGSPILGRPEGLRFGANVLWRGIYVN